MEKLCIKPMGKGFAVYNAQGAFNYVGSKSEAAARLKSFKSEAAAPHVIKHGKTQANGR